MLRFDRSGWVWCALSVLALNLGSLFTEEQALSAQEKPQPPSVHLNFFVTPEEIGRQCRFAMEKAEKRYRKLAKMQDAKRTFENTPAFFQDVESDLDDESKSLIFLKNVSTDKEVREASHECGTMLKQFMVEIYTREDLYAALKGYAAKGERLEGEDKKLLEKILLEYRRNGLELEAEEREKIKALKKRLVELEAEFGKNLIEVKDYLAVTREELEGLPEDFIERLEPLEEGKFKVTLDYPDYRPFMRNAKSADARRRLQEKYHNRAADKNVKLLEEAIKLRREIAEILGYPTHAHYVLEDRMAKDPARAQEFLERLRSQLNEKAEEELQELSSLKKQEEGPHADPEIRAWDFAYYHNLMKKTKYDVDEEKLKEYFPLELVTQGMLSIYQRVLGLVFREVKPPYTWHPDVQLFEVRDAHTEELIGYFYMDLFPREGKFKHAAAFDLVQGRRLEDGSYQKPVSAIVANLNKPAAGKPSLLKHGELRTFFHEFGHIMHEVLTKATYTRFSGTTVAWDFVEAPSQMMENWIWDAQILESLSGHYKDLTQKIPEALVQRMVEVRNVDSGLRYLAQVFYASVDMAYHTKPEVKNSTELYGELQKRIALIEMTPGTHPQASFGHLMGGYDAGYYGYLWSEVYAQDMLTRFEKRGLLSDEVGQEYRRLILEPGSSVEEADQIRKFLGREPNEEAFLRSIGLKPS